MGSGWERRPGLANKMRKVSLLGAFEIQAEADPPVRDGLILGSRREQLGFVLETSRENIEQIVAIAAPAKPGLPMRLASALGPMLETMGYVLRRVELIPLPLEDELKEEGYGSYVQGWLVYGNEGSRKSRRLAMTATESIQVALAAGLPIMASVDLLQLNVSQFLGELDEANTQQSQETRKFHAFVENITATDFQRFYEEKLSDGDEEEPSP
ncbi:MAG: hypothetical protein JWM80_5115 [Cyanobacteria bacterium RYN_339]|nr:hypothetical protein [Cyanobacteria bacterium RYN_339]